MKRPLLPVALFYVGGLLLADLVQPPLSLLFAVALGLFVLTLIWARARVVLLWPLLVLVGWTNLVSRTAVLSPHDLRLLVGNEPVLTTVRGRLDETPSLRVYEHEDRESSRTLARLTVTAVAQHGAWHPASGCHGDH